MKRQIRQVLVGILCLTGLRGGGAATDYEGRPFVTNRAPDLLFEQKVAPSTYGIDYSFPEQTARGVALFSRFPSFTLRDRRMHTSGPWYNSNSVNLHFTHGFNSIDALPNYRLYDTNPTSVRMTLICSNKWQLMTDPMWWSYATQLYEKIVATNSASTCLPALQLLGYGVVSNFVTNHYLTNNQAAYLELGRYVWKNEKDALDVQGKGALYRMIDIELTGGWEHQRQCFGWLYQGMHEEAANYGADMIPVTYGQYTFSIGTVADSERGWVTNVPHYLESSYDYLAGDDPTLQACRDYKGVISMDGYVQGIWGQEPFYIRNADGTLFITNGYPVYSSRTNTTAYGWNLLLEANESKACLEHIYRQATRMYLMHHWFDGTYPSNSTTRRSHLVNSKIGAWIRYSNEGVLGIVQNDRPLPGWEMEMCIGMYLMLADDIVFWSSDFNNPPGALGGNYTNYWKYNAAGVVEYAVKAAHRYSAMDAIHTGAFNWCWFALPMVNGNRADNDPLKLDGERYYERPIAFAKLRTYNSQPWIEMYAAYPACDSNACDMKLWVDKGGTNKSGAYTLKLANGRSYFYDAWQLPSAFTNLQGSNVWLQFRDQIGVVRTWRGDWRVAVTGAVTPPADVDAGGTRYVSKTGTHTTPYTNWTMAATSIQAAVNVALSGETIVVGTGVYANGAASATNMVYITNAITLRALSSDPGATVIDGGGTRRGILMTAPAYIQGFTIRNGRGDSGGGIVGTNGGDIWQCIITNNSSTNGHGGGISIVGGRIRNCLVAANVASNASNTRDGGGIYGYGVVIQNCTVVRNSAGRNGTGIMLDRRAPLDNRVENSIVYFNRGSTANIVATNTPVVGGLTIDHSCSPGIGTVAGNIEVPPRFWNLDRNEYRLAGDSPCRNAATNSGWILWAVDLAGSLRNQDGNPDMGAFESPAPRYVNAAGPAPVAPYESWATAAQSIQAALVGATTGQSIIVAAGVYDSAVGASDSTNLLVLSMPVMVMADSENPWDTVLDGSGTRRCARLAGSSILSGFTLRNGFVPGDGGGAWLAASDIQNCWVISNTALNGMGGGLAATGAVVRDCLIAANVATNAGNTASAGALYAIGTRIVNATLVDNRAGGAAPGLLVDRRGGVTNDLINSIAWYNVGGGADIVITNSGGGLIQSNSCSPPLTAGVNGNSTNEPRFASRALGDYRLAFNSPGLNAGLVPDEWGMDAGGLNRWLGAMPDMGALELPLVRYAMPTNPAAAAPYTNWATAASGIQPALNLANAGETVVLATGLYSAAQGTVDGTNLIWIPDDVCVRASSTNVASTIIDGSGLYRPVYMEPGSELRGLTLRNGRAEAGGGAVIAPGNATIEGCVATNNVAFNGHGGAMLVGGGLIRNCVVGWSVASNGVNDRSGGGIYFGGLGQQGGRIENCTVLANYAGDDGSGILIDNRAATGVVVNCIAFGNSGARLTTKDVEYDKGTNPVSITYTCASNLVAGVNGNLVSHPFFQTGTTQLSSNSPCLGRGLLLDWMTPDGQDIGQAARVQGGVVDLGAWESPWTVATPVVAGGITVATNEDDVEERTNGVMSLNSSDLELGWEGPTAQQVGIRFAAVPVPRNATILSAFLQFMADETNNVATTLVIRGENADQSAAFTTNQWNVSSRPLTAAAVTWNPVEWMWAGESDERERTPDIKVIVQEVVGRAGWASNNAMTFIVTGTGTRIAEARESAGVGTNGPILFVEWTTNVFNGDGDGDGLSDAWEIGYFGGTTATNGGAGQDADGDGLSNFGEFIAGTDPTNLYSTLELRPTNALNPRVIQWSASAGRRYTVLYLSNTSDSAWVPLVTNLNSAYPSMNVYTDTLHNGATRGFYRVRGRLAP